jgi:hypothetical protein
MLTLVFSVPLTLVLSLTQQPAGVVQQVMVTSGQVERIDRAGRLITILSEGVVQAPIYAGPDLPVFDQLNPGDYVVVRYYDAYIVEATPGARMGPPENTTADAQQRVARPDAEVMQQLRLVVTIDAIDGEKGMVTYHGFDNRRVLRAVQHPQVLEKLRVGDVVTITYTRARAVGIERAP